MSRATTAKLDWSSQVVAIQAIPRADRGQIPFYALLLAAALSGSMWWGIIAGLRWIWQSA